MDQYLLVRLTPRARRIAKAAKDEARKLKHNYIGTEHLLLALTSADDGIAVRALESLGASVDAVREQVIDIIGEGQQRPTGRIPLTPRAKKALELALYGEGRPPYELADSEHLLLGLIREGEGVAAQVLGGLGVSLEQVRLRVHLLMDGLPLPGEVSDLDEPPTPDPGFTLSVNDGVELLTALVVVCLPDGTVRYAQFDRATGMWQ